MAITFVAAGALANDAALPSLGVVAPACAVNDILVCAIMNKALANVISPPDATWAEIIQDSVDTTTVTDGDFRFAVFRRKATASGGTFTFTKATDDNLLFAGVISAWRGSPNPEGPLDATAVGVQKTITAVDAVSFPAFDPTHTDVHVIFLAFYGNDLTTYAAAMSNDVNPDCTTRFDLETNAGTDCSIACTSGDSTGANIAARTWASAATADSTSAGVVFALRATSPYFGADVRYDVSGAGFSMEELLMPGPVKNVAFITDVALRDAALPGTFRANPTLAAGDVTVSGDEGAFGNLATLPTVTPASGVNVKVSLSAGEMNFDRITVRFKDQTATAEWMELYLVIHTAAA